MVLMARLRCGLVGGVAAMLVLWSVARSDAQTNTGDTLKAAFLYNFAKFAEWPADALSPGQPLALCVMGDHFVAFALEKTIQGHAVEGHQLTVEVLQPDSPIRTCHLLYVSPAAARQSAQLLDSLKESPVLTVGDTDTFAEQGGVAQLVFGRDRMRFVINVTAAQRARIALSSQLLSLAKIVKEQP